MNIKYSRVFVIVNIRWKGRLSMLIMLCVFCYNCFRLWFGCSVNRLLNSFGRWIISLFSSVMLYSRLMMFIM